MKLLLLPCCLPLVLPYSRIAHEFFTIFVPMEKVSTSMRSKIAQAEAPCAEEPMQWRITPSKNVDIQQIKKAWGPAAAITAFF